MWEGAQPVGYHSRSIAVDQGTTRKLQKKKKMMNQKGHEETRRLEFDKLSNRVIGCAIEGHRNLGPGLLGSIYENCLGHEFQIKDIPLRLQHPIPVEYKDIMLDCGYRIDILVDNRIKSVDKGLPIRQAQLLTYMKLSNISIGLLVNFNVQYLKNGIKRMVL